MRHGAHGERTKDNLKLPGLNETRQNSALPLSPLVFRFLALINFPCGLAKLTILAKALKNRAAYTRRRLQTSVRSVVVHLLLRRRYKPEENDWICNLKERDRGA